jgi:hypothetical protein
MSYRNALVCLIISGIVARCIIASSVEFGNDEVYYWTYSQHLQWNYFDHPPMVALLIRLTTFNLSFQHLELFVRLGGIICSAFATYFLYRAVLNMSDERAAFFAALLYNASLYGCIITGVFILPDSPQMFFWTASLFVLSKLLVSEKPRTSDWMFFGVMTGLTIMSKIHGVFIWSGLLLYILLHRRKWLGLWQLYVSLFICLIIVTPFLLWNVENNFITYQYHSSRLEGVKFKGDNFSREIFGEIFYNNPINVVLTFISLSWFLRNSKAVKNDFLTVCLLISIPMIVLLLVLAMFNDTLPHWTGPAYITLLPLAAVYLAQKRKIHNKIPRVVRFSLGFTLFVIVVGILSVNFYPGTLGKQNSVSKFGEGDVTLDMYGWNIAAEKIDSLVNIDEQKGEMPHDAEFISNKWYPAAHIDYYIARPLGKFVIGVGELNDLHHYEWLNEFRLTEHAFHDAYCVFPSDYSCDVKKFYAGLFTSIDSVGTFPIYRSKKVCKYFSIYRLKNFVGEIPKLR